MNKFRTAIILLLAFFGPFVASAEWSYTLSPYAWLPSVDVSVDGPGGGRGVDIDSGSVLDNTEWALMAALDKSNGRTVWTTDPLDDIASYCSPILFRHMGRRVIANCSSGHGFGVDADTGNATLSSSAPLVLFKLAKAMEGEPDVRLAIVGHTDSTGNFDYNVDLSQRRAETVRNTLLGEPYNVPEERLVAMGAGPIKPVASNLSEEGRALNRRVVFVLLGEHFMEN